MIYSFNVNGSITFYYLFFFLLLPGGPGMNGLLSVSASVCRSNGGGFEIDSQFFTFVQAVGYLDHVSAGGTDGNGFRFQLLPVLDPYETFPGRGLSRCRLRRRCSLVASTVCTSGTKRSRLGWDCQYVIAFQREDRHVGCQARLQFKVGLSADITTS